MAKREMSAALSLEGTGVAMVRATDVAEETLSPSRSGLDSTKTASPWQLEMEVEVP